MTFDQSAVDEIDGKDIDPASVETDALVIGGTLYEEDDNSPIDVSGTSSTTFTPATVYDEVVLLSDPAVTGFDQLQANGDTGANYDTITNDGNEITGQTQFPITTGNNRWYLTIRDIGNRVRIGVGLAGGTTGFTVQGQNNNLGGNGINQLMLSDSGGSNRTAKTRVFGREI